MRAADITSAARAPAAPARRGSPADEAAWLRAWQANGRVVDSRDPRAIAGVARQTVAEVFFQPLLEQSREFPFGKTFADGGQTEQMFAQRLYTRVAETVAGRDHGGLARQVEREIRAQHALQDGQPAEAARLRGGLSA